MLIFGVLISGGMTAQPSYGGLGVSVSAPLRQEIDAFCDAADKATVKKSLYSRHEYEGGKMSAWSTTTLEKEQAVQNNPSFIEGEIGSLLLLKGHPVIATVTQISGTGDGATETEYCYKRGRLARMRATLSSVTFEMRWVGTTYYISAEKIGPFVQKKDLARHRTVAAPMPHFDLPVYSTPARLPFYSLRP